MNLSGYVERCQNYWGSTRSRVWVPWPMQSIDRWVNLRNPDMVAGIREQL